LVLGRAVRVAKELVHLFVLFLKPLELIEQQQLLFKLQGLGLSCGERVVELVAEGLPEVELLADRLSAEIKALDSVLLKDLLVLPFAYVGRPVHDRALVHIGRGIA